VKEVKHGVVSGTWYGGERMLLARGRRHDLDGHMNNISLPPMQCAKILKCVLTT
jgi:hypothetical protein